MKLRLSIGLAALAACPTSALAQQVSGKPFNPDISSVITGLYQRPGSGLSLDEVELQVMADVDPYLRAVALLSVHQADAKPDPAAPAGPQEKAWAIEPEEAYVETIALPVVTVKAGRFRVAIDRENQLHPHAYPFIDAPLVNQRLLGPDGLIEAGVAAAALLPLPWFVEATAQVLQGDSTYAFASQTPGTAAGVYRLRSLWDLSDATTLDVAVSGSNGANYWGGHTEMLGADAMVKWRPTQGGNRNSFAVAGEYLQGDVRERPTDPKIHGYAYWAIYQPAERWRVEARNQTVSQGAPGGWGQTNMASALVGFAPSEFSDLRLQYDHEKPQSARVIQRVALELNVTIGAHPAHAY